VKGSFQITLIVDPAPIPPLAMDGKEPIGPATVKVTQGTKLPITGGTPPYVITNVQGQVPPGLTINADGTIEGTPTSPGSFTLTIDVQDQNG
jgi:hypothetical protein